MRKNGTCPWLRPDGKTQVTVEYKKDGGAVVPLRVHTILISTQHNPDVSNEKIKEDLMEHVIKPVVRGGTERAWLPAGSHKQGLWTPPPRMEAIPIPQRTPARTPTPTPMKVHLLRPAPPRPPRPPGAREVPGRQDHLPPQPQRPLRDWRPPRRCWPHR